MAISPHEMRPLLRVDGKFQSLTKQYFQRYMKHHGWYTRAIDGGFGVQSWKAVQRMCKYHGYYNRAIDGDPGNHTWSALSRLFHDKWPHKGALNHVSYGTIEASWSWRMVETLQRGMNSFGRFRYNYLP